MKKLLKYIALASVMLLCTAMMLTDLWNKGGINSAADVIVLIGISLFVILMDAILFTVVYVTEECK